MLAKKTAVGRWGWGNLLQLTGHATIRIHGDVYYSCMVSVTVILFHVGYTLPIYEFTIQNQDTVNVYR